MVRREAPLKSFTAPVKTGSIPGDIRCETVRSQDSRFTAGLRYRSRPTVRTGSNNTKSYPELPAKKLKKVRAGSIQPPAGTCFPGIASIGIEVVLQARRLNSRNFDHASGLCVYKRLAIQANEFRRPAASLDFFVDRAIFGHHIRRRSSVVRV